MGGVTRAELLDELEPNDAPRAERDAAPSLEDLLVYVSADELDGVPAAVAGVVLAAREMGRALAERDGVPSEAGGAS
jgi:hypothetical protein